MLYPVNEVFQSIQGEATHTGTPSIFVRLQGCHIGCAFCDTKHTCLFNPLLIVVGFCLPSEAFADQGRTELKEDQVHIFISNKPFSFSGCLRRKVVAFSCSGCSNREVVVGVTESIIATSFFVLMLPNQDILGNPKFICKQQNSACNDFSNQV